MAWRQAGWQWRGGEEMRAGLGEVCSEKKCRVEGFGRAESALMQTLQGAYHTLTHARAHTHAHLYTGIQWVLPWHRLVYLPYQNVILGRVCSRNSDSLLHCEAITWSNRARLIAWTGSATSHSLLRSSRIIGIWTFFPPTHARDLSRTSFEKQEHVQSARVVSS